MACSVSLKMVLHLSFLFVSPRHMIYFPYSHITCLLHIENSYKYFCLNKYVQCEIRARFISILKHYIFQTYTLRIMFNKNNLAMSYKYSVLEQTIINTRNVKNNQYVMLRLHRFMSNRSNDQQ